MSRYDRPDERIDEYYWADRRPIGHRPPQSLTAGEQRLLADVLHRQLDCPRCIYCRMAFELSDPWTADPYCSRACAVQAEQEGA